MIIKIITPNKIIFSEETDLFIIPALEGDIGVLDYHSPLITALRPGIVYIYQKKSIAKTFFLNDGIFEFSNNKGILTLKWRVPNLILEVYNREFFFRKK